MVSKQSLSVYLFTRENLENIEKRKKKMKYPVLLPKEKHC